MNSSPPLLDVVALYRYYGNRCAVQGISFQVQRGEVVGFLGRNGAGKTSTLQMLAGCLAPSRGQIRIGGYDITEEPLSAKTLLGYLPEQSPLYPELTVDEYLLYTARLRNVPRREQFHALQQAKERCGLVEVGQQLIGTLSKGYQQRLGVAQALIHSPPLVLLDEPTVGLDPLQVREMRKLIQALGTDHGVLLSSHILSEVQAVCDRVQIIHQGQLVANDTVVELGQRLTTTRLLVRIAHPPATGLVETLQTISGVQQVELLEAGYLRLFCRNNPAQAVAELVVTAGWGLLELTPDSSGLEEMFVNLTTGI